MRFRRGRWQVFDEDGQCAANLRKADALKYASGRASVVGQAVQVCRMNKRGVLVIAGGFYAPERHTPSRPL
jgi:hypothetical protein